MPCWVGLGPPASEPGRAARRLRTLRGSRSCSGRAPPPPNRIMHMSSGSGHDTGRAACTTWDVNGHGRCPGRDRVVRTVRYCVRPEAIGVWCGRSLRYGARGAQRSEDSCEIRNQEPGSHTTHNTQPNSPEQAASHKSKVTRGPRGGESQVESRERGARRPPESSHTAQRRHAGSEVTGAPTLRAVGDVDAAG